MKLTIISISGLFFLLLFSQSCRKPSTNNARPDSDTCILKNISYGMLPDYLANTYSVSYENGNIISLTSSRYIIKYKYNSFQHLKRSEKYLKSTNELVASEEYITNNEGQVVEQLDTVFIPEEGYQKSINRCENIYINNQLVEKQFFDRYNNLNGRNLLKWNNNNIATISRYYDNQLVDSIEISYDTTKFNKITNGTLQLILQDLAPGSSTQFQFPFDIIQVSSQHLISKISSVTGLTNYNISYQFNGKGYINTAELNGAFYWRFTYSCD